MHYFAAVLVPNNTEDIDGAVSAAMAPFNGKWDWWQIGGRWTGVWSDYDPAKDPANHETCRMCSGTGLRNDELGRQHREKDPSYTCNGCGYEPHPGGGVAVVWPTQFQRHPGDVVRVAQLLDTDTRTPHDVLSPTGWSAKEWWTGKDIAKDEEWEKTYRAALEPYRDTHLAVVVDYHC